MATVDYGIIVRTEGDWVYVKPRCPYCGHFEQSDWNVIPFGIPRLAYSRKPMDTPARIAERALPSAFIPDDCR